MTRTIAGVFWIALYLLVVLVPVFLMLVPPAPSGRGFWLEFGVALGFVGLTQIAIQFVLIARLRRVTAPYGIDIILHYHRQIALVAVGAILLHPTVIVLDNPSRLELLNPLGGNMASRMAWVSVTALLLIVTSSVWRDRLSIPYEWWRLSHVVLGIVAIVSAQLHVSMAGLYTNTAWKQAVWIGIAVAMVGFVGYLRVGMPAWQRGRRWRVAEVREEPGDTHTLVLAPDGHAGMHFLPGQFAWIKVGASPFTLDEHPFSMASSAEQPDRVAFGIKALGDFSGRVADIAPGSVAYIDGPHGAFSIDRYEAAGYVFIAGGIGITPLLSCLRTMADRGDRRPVLLFYADTTRDGMAYRDALETLRARLDLTIVDVIEHPADDWQGETGLLTPEVLARHLPDASTPRMYFLCGPEPMLDAVRPALQARGVPDARIQLERFALV